MLQKETRSVRFAAVGVIVGSVGMVALVALALLPLLRPTVNVYPSPREVVDTASTTLVNNLHATGSATIDGATVAHKLTNTGALNTTNTADGWVSLVTESASAFDFTAPPYGPVTLPTFSVNDATADSSLSHCTGVNCAEVLGWPVCAYHGTGLNGADAACYDGPVIGDDSTWRTSVTTPSVTSTSVSDLTVAAGGFNNTVIGTTAGATRFPAATASTMLAVDASKNLTSYAGSTCGGGTFATGISAAGAVACGAAPAGFTSTATTGNLMSATSSTSAGNFAGSTCGAGTFANGISAAGALACASTSGAASISIPSPVAQTTSTVNISTLGTIDWFWCPQGATSTSEPHMLAWSSSQSDVSGGFFARSFGVVKRQNWGTANTEPITIATNGVDSWNGSNNGGANVCQTWSGGGITAHGFAWQVPAANVQQVMRLYVGGGGIAATLSCNLSVSGTQASQLHDFGVGADLYVVYTVTFTGGATGDQLSCRWLVTTANAATESIYFAAASLGPT